MNQTIVLSGTALFLLGGFLALYFIRVYDISTNNGGD